MPAQTTLPDITPANLNDVVIAMERQHTNDFTDIVNTKKPLQQALLKANAIIDEPPGLGPNRDVKFTQSRRAQFMSLSQTTVPRDFAETEFMTQAQYNYIMWVVTMTIPKMKFEHTKGALARFNYVKRQVENKDVDLELTYNDVLWDGKTVGTDRCWGINDYVQFDPTADPDAGAIGRLSVANFPEWANQTANYNGPLVSLAAGGRLSCMLDTGENSLSSVHYRASDNVLDGTLGAPDLMLVNEPYQLALEQLWRDGLLAKSPSSDNQLGVDGFRYKDMTIVRDNRVPDDPNNNSYGVGIGLNCKRGFEVVYAEGLRRQVSDMEKHPTHHGFYWDTYVSMTTACAHRGLNFVHYGIKPAAAA